MARVASKSDYVRLIKELLPPGPAWPRDDTTSTYAVVIDEIAGLCASLDAQAGELVEESDPLTCAQSFEDWETEWGLPYTCEEHDITADDQTLAFRRAMLLFKTRMTHGQSRQFYIDLAAFFGREATVEELRDGEDESTNYQWRITFRDNASYTDYGRLNDMEYEESTEDYGLLANCPGECEEVDLGLIDTDSIGQYTQATVMMGANDPLADWGDEFIECVIEKYKPAHTKVFFAYA